jgi:hypothetical protein
MTKRKQRVWFDNLIYLVAGFAAVAGVVAMINLKIEFPRRTILATLTTLFLAYNLLIFFRTKWKSIGFWTSFVPLMAIHAALTVFLLGPGIPILFACLMMGPEFFAIGSIIHWTTASGSKS